MKITITKAVAPNSAVEPFDVLQLKKSLNRLGYYYPPKDMGITDIPDSGLFSAIKDFQKAFGLTATGTTKPDDDTITTINRELGKPQKGYYVWSTVGDDRVRPEHEAMDGTIRSWDDPITPDTEFGCRCWADPVSDNISQIYDPPIRPVYPELLLLPMLRLGKLYSLWKSWSETRDTEWTLGKFKSDTKWGNQLKNRDWTPEQITETIYNGNKFPAPNNVNSKNAATRYEYKGRYVVRDDITKEILQVSKPDFKRPQF